MAKTRISLVGVLLLCLISFYGIGYSQRDDKEIFENSSLFTKVFTKIQKNYVEDIKTKELFHGAINGMLGTLDPHSAFLSPDLYKEMQVDTSGQFGGLGIEVTKKPPIDNSPIHVITPLIGTPAYNAGIMAGDYIIKIEGKSTYDMQLHEAVNLLRGKIDTKVKITIYRKSTEKEFSLEIVRKKINIESIKFVKFVDKENGIGYVKVEHFSQKTAADLQEALKLLIKHGMQGFILDLRFNPGGLLDSAIAVSDIFINKGLVVATSTRESAPESLKTQNDRRFYASATSTLPYFPMVILINGASASASEIVSGALKDHNRAILVGEKSFGKGSVQTLFQIPGENKLYALKLTTARYYTPSGFKQTPRISIDKKGIKPDIEIKMDKKQLKALYESIKKEWLKYNKKQNKMNSEEMLKESIPPDPADLQMKEALRILKSKLIFDKWKNKAA